MYRWLLALPVLLLLPMAAQADVIHLHNGRTMEGKVVSKKRGKVTLKVPGGMLTIPASTVKRIEKKRTPQEEYGIRARKVDMHDARQVSALATWCSSRGLGEQAQHLRALAKGLRLETKIARLRDGGSARDYLNVYDWARGSGYSDEVQRWLLDRALEIDPEHEGSKSALRRMVEAEEAREAARRERAELARRAKEKSQPEDDDELTELREKLEAQRVASEKLKQRLAQLEEERAREDEALRRQNIVLRRRRRIRRQRGGYGNPVLVVVDDPNNCPPGTRPARPAPLRPAARPRTSLLPAPAPVIGRPAGVASPE